MSICTNEATVQTTLSEGNSPEGSCQSCDYVDYMCAWQRTGDKTRVFFWGGAVVPALPVATCLIALDIRLLLHDTCLQWKQNFLPLFPEMAPILLACLP